jgi:hypothetical protein
MFIVRRSIIAAILMVPVMSHATGLIWSGCVKVVAVNNSLAIGGLILVPSPAISGSAQGAFQGQYPLK